MGVHEHRTVLFKIGFPLRPSHHHKSGRIFPIMAATGLSPAIQKQLAAVKNDPQNASAWQALGDLLAEGGDARRALHAGFFLSAFLDVPFRAFGFFESVFPHLQHW